jgi:hypothetical protein
MSKIQNNLVRWLLALALVLMALFGVVGSTQAAEFIEETIAEGEVIDDDVFVTGEHVIVNGTVNGDLFAFGQTVTINGVVNGSLFIGAQTVTVNGSVTGSIYGGAAALTLGDDGTVGRNLLFGGFSLQTEAGSTIGRDMMMGGYQALLAGTVERDIKVGVGALELAGKVGGDVNATVGTPGEGKPNFVMMPGELPPSVEPGLRVAESAEIGGQLNYSSREDQASAIEGEPAGGVLFEESVEEMNQATESVGMGGSIVGWFFTRLQELLSLLVLGGLVIWSMPYLFSKAVHKAEEQPLPSAGWGVATLLVGYVGALIIAVLIIVLAIILGFITLGGLAGTVIGVGFGGLGVVFISFQLLVSYGSKLIVAFLGGKLFLERFSPKYAEHKGWTLLLGVALYVLLRGIPFIGWLIGLAATLIGLGALWLIWREAPATPITKESPVM